MIEIAQKPVAEIAPTEARALFRDGMNVTTSGWSTGWAQANLLAVPKDLAFDVLLFAQRNPKSCPLLDVFDAGAYSSQKFQGDLRQDLPQYRIYRNGELAAEQGNVIDEWREDLVAFLFGCSFTFENPMVDAGIEMRHNRDELTVPMYRTNRKCVPTDRLGGPLVVTMRGIPEERVVEAVRITSRYPSVHGAPVHIGSPASLGIDLNRPDWGNTPVLEEGDVPVFWACGVTPQAMVMESKPEFAISHSPGRMAIMDIRDSELIVP